MQPTRRITGVAFFAGAMALLAGCDTTSSLTLRDRNAPGTAVRATFRGTKGDPPQRAGAGVELGMETYRAKGTQRIAAGEVFVFGNTSYPGPQDMQNDVRLSQFHVAYNHLIRIGQHAELEPYVGAVHLRMNIHTTPASGGGGTGVEGGRSGVTVGVTPRWRFNDQLAVELRYNNLYTRSIGLGRSFEGVVVLSPAPHVALRLGWVEREFSIFTNFTDDPSSNVTVRSGGPLATLQFDF